MIQLSNHDQIKNHQASKKAQILESFTNEENREAKLITKGELDALYPEATFQRYSLKNLNAFREELKKSMDDPDAAFVAATKDLKHLVLVHEGKQAFVFVRKKEAGE